MELQLAFSPFCFSSISCEILLLPLIIYLLRLPQKTLATRQLLGFFTSLFVSLAATFFLHALPYWWAEILWPLQDALVMVSGLFLIRFAYLFPHDDRIHERRVFSGIYIALSIGALAYCARYAYLILSHRVPSEMLSRLYLLLMPLFLLLCFAILVRRSLYYAALPSPVQIGWAAYRRAFGKALIHPLTPYGRAFRNFALAILFGLLPGFGSIFVSSEIFSVYYIALGTIFTVSALMLAYVNHSTESISFIVKLVGISLVTFVSVFGIVGVEDLVSSRRLYVADVRKDGLLSRKSVMAHDFTNLPESLLYAVTQAMSGGPSAYTPLFIRPGISIWPDGLPDGELFQDAPTPQRWLVWTMDEVAEYLLSNERGVTEKYIAYRFPHQGYFYEIGLSLEAYYQAGHARAVKRILQLCLGSLLVIGLFPFFFYMNLVRPLKNLLAGVMQANMGSLHIQLDVQYEDEIGFLTRAFNQMLHFLREMNVQKDELNVALKKANDELESRVEQRTDELLQTKENAESAYRAKSAFLANMSHEFRTPLNAILGYTQILRHDNNLNDSQRQAVHTIHRSSEHLLLMINDILDLSRIEAQKIELSLTSFHLADFLLNLVQIVKGQAEQKGLTLENQFAHNLPVTLQGDEKRLRQVLLNLLNNGIKFTETGTITFRVKQFKRAGTPHDVTPSETFHFEVEDTGIGISEEHLEHVFLSFYQAEGVPQFSEGTGLGLAISRHLVRMMGGELFVSSSPGKGSRFWFELELGVPDKQEDEQGAWHELLGRSALAPSTEQKPWILPPQEELDTLIQAVTIGNITHVKSWISRIQELDRDYEPFVEKIRRFAARYEFDGLLAYLKSLHLQEKL